MTLAIFDGPVSAERFSDRTYPTTVINGTIRVYSALNVDVLVAPAPGVDLPPGPGAIQQATRAVKKGGILLAAAAHSSSPHDAIRNMNSNVEFTSAMDHLISHVHLFGSQAARNGQGISHVQGRDRAQSIVLELMATAGLQMVSSHPEAFGYSRVVDIKETLGIIKRDPQRALASLNGRGYFVPRTSTPRR